MGAAEDLGARIGFAGGTSLTSIDQVRADASWASQVGFDSYWVSYVFGVDPLVALPVVANDAPDIELGTSVVPMVGRHPISMAQLARSAQQACDGRFTLGIGPSHRLLSRVCTASAGTNRSSALASTSTLSCPCARASRLRQLAISSPDI